MLQYQQQGGGLACNTLLAQAQAQSVSLVAFY